MKSCWHFLIHESKLRNSKGCEYKMTNERKPGRAKQDLSDESTSKILKTAKSLIRTDWGGKNSDEIIRQKLASRGIDADLKMVTAVREIAEEQVKGCRKRIGKRVDEAIRRCDAPSDK